MNYINKYGLIITDDIDIIADVFDVNLLLQRNSIPLSSNLGVFNTSFSEFNSSNEDSLSIDLTKFIKNNDYLSSNISLEPNIDIDNKVLKIEVTVNDDDNIEQRSLVFDEVF
jgi:hypothetical protein